MRLNDLGDELYVQARAAATLSYTPKNGRDGLVTKIAQTNPSGADTWNISVGGKNPLMAMFDGVSKLNSVLLDHNKDYPKGKNIFEWVQEYLGRSMAIPVPNGDTLTVASVGGATSDLYIKFEEYTSGSMTPDMVNHYNGTHYLLPVWARRAANVAATGRQAYDTQIGPPWLPNFLLPEITPSGWRILIHALFAIGGSVNAYAAATDHISYTQNLSLDFDGTTKFTRTQNGGPPLLGSAAAAGSANTVLEATINDFAPMNENSNGDENLLDRPWELQPGTVFNPYVNYQGDVGAGAAYGNANLLAIIETFRM